MQRYLSGSGFAAAVVDEDRCAGPGKGERGGTADAARGTGDEGGFA
jgi:hypothetical protein